MFSVFCVRNKGEQQCKREQIRLIVLLVEKRFRGELVRIEEGGGGIGGL